MDELGSQEEMAHVEKIMREGTGADRQIGAWEREHNMHDVVDLIVAETYERHLSGGSRSGVAKSLAKARATAGR